MRRWIAPLCGMLSALLAWPVAATQPLRSTTSDQPPRKVIVGTAMQAFWVSYPGLQKRLKELSELVDGMAREAQRKYSRGLDLAVLPEVALTGELSGEPAAQSVAFEGPVHEAFARVAREHHCYVIVPTYLLDDSSRKLCSNAAILVGREGELVGIYRKVHLAVQTGSDSMEHGTTPGKEAPVFQCDFGKLGIQICFDMEFDSGWEQMAQKGADLVAWPTQSPQTSDPAFRAKRYGYYIVSSTWRNNASFFEPTGKIIAQIREPAHVLVQELDLSYAILPWSSQLQNGGAFSKKYGDRAGFRYYEDEDAGIFWSNDPQVPVGRMLRSLGLVEASPELERIRKLYRKAGVPGY